MVFSLFFFVTYILELDAYARAGGSRSFGSRGSRSYSAPSSPSAAPSSPSRMAPAPAQQAAPSQSGGFMRGIAGGIVGGMIGGMLFRSLGFGSGDGVGGGGIGLFEIILIGGILYGIWWYIKRRRREAEATAGPAAYRTAEMPQPQQSGFAPAYGSPAGVSEIAAGISHIRQMDASFDEQKFKDQCMDAFFKVQGAWANRDMSSVRNMLTSEMYGIIQGDADDLKKKKQINRLENIAVRQVELSEVWQEAGKDFVTVRFTANLLDYTTDETTGNVISGSKTEPVKFEEFWTYTRPVGSNSWQLSAINQPS
ncbi:MAG: Tim44 domain-containing protein [Deltaproteobacteria bacterium HGW-Deltaproteobacteria-12]|nr:MAG: Tim44 domain-containing protein [Deltaproteobacteria bacterium HGW-Deltaproteobacteria-12]